MVWRIALQAWPPCPSLSVCLSCLQLPPDPEQVRGNLHSWLQRLTSLPACLFRLNNMTQIGGHGREGVQVLVKLPFPGQSKFLKQNKRTFSLSPQPWWSIVVSSIGFIPSFPFCKNICTETSEPDPQSAADRSPGFPLQHFTG